MNLSDTTKEILEKQKKAESRGALNEHLDTNETDQYIPVNQEFSYDKKWYQKIGYYFLRKGVVSPYEWIANHCWLKTEVVGKANLNGLYGGAILTCNHVNKLDSLVIGYALKQYKIHFTVAEFNNMKSRLGSYMRAYGIMPIPSKRSYFPKFERQLKKYLDQGDWINFFPECSEWWCYEKPRPYQIGAFHYAAKYNVPILPMFITFRKTKKYKKNGLEKRKFVLHILRPIYPDLSLSFKERKEELRRKNEEAVWACYKRFYLDHF